MGFIYKFIIITFLSLLLFSCGNTRDKHLEEDKNTKIDSLLTVEESIQFDLEDIIKSDTLRAITIYSPTSYFLYKGEVMGFEYELLKRMAEEMGLQLKIIIAKDMDQMIDRLNKGDADIIAYGMTITKNRKKLISFTKPYMKIHEVLIQRKGPDEVTDVTELGERIISVRKNSSYIERLKNVSDEIGENIYIDTIPGKYSTDEIIQMVENGDINYTIADNNISNVNSTYYNDLNMSVPVSLSRNLAWIVRKSSTNLLEELNRMITNSVGGLEYNILYNKYFKNKRRFAKRIGSEFYSKETGRISKYDNLIKKYAKNIKWDWRLLASQIYQESRFNNHGRSWMGAKGLMQIMPRTAKGLGIDDVHQPNQNIQGGTKYLQQIWEKWNQIPDSIQRIKFTLASYNCGLYHVKDAQILAKKYHKNSLVWDNGVDEFILKLSKAKYFNQKEVKYGYVRGLEPFNYVKEIFERYAIYKDLLN